MSRWTIGAATIVCFALGLFAASALAGSGGLGALADLITGSTSTPTDTGTTPTD